MDVSIRIATWIVHLQTGPSMTPYVKQLMHNKIKSDQQPTVDLTFVAFIDLVQEASRRHILKRCQRT